jgi:alanine racemase
MSHLSTPDNFEVTNVQLSDFQTSVDQLQSLGISPKYIHIFASGGLINAKNYATPVGNIARTGLAFYGYGHPDLQPALRCTTQLTQIKHIQKGDTV